MKLHFKYTAGLALLLILLAGCNLPTTTTPTPLPTATAAVVNTAAVPTATAGATAVPPTDTPAPTAAPAATSTSAVQPTAQGVPLTITSQRMFDASNGWGVGTYQTDIQDILRTSDGGKTWKVFSPPEQNRAKRNVVSYFQDLHTAWVIYTASAPDANAKSFAVWHTTDDGANWKSSTVDGGSMVNEFFVPGQVGFFDAANGWVLVHMGVGMNHDYISVWTTADGGATWKAVVDPTKDNLSMSCSKDGVWFRDAQHGYAAGSCNGVMKGLLFYQTADGGATWSLVNLPAPAGNPDVFTSDNSMCGADHLSFQSAERGQLLVRCSDMSSNTPTARRWFYSTADGGKTWTSAILPAAWGEINMLDATTGWYLAQPASDQTKGTKVFHTTDGGKTWTQIGTVNWSGPIQFVDAKTGWVVAQIAGSQALALVRSQNGGTSWDLLNTMLGK